MASPVVVTHLCVLFFEGITQEGIHNPHLILMEADVQINSPVSFFQWQF
jgi:hypothetical protein